MKTPVRLTNCQGVKVFTILKKNQYANSITSRFIINYDITITKYTTPTVMTEDRLLMKQIKSKRDESFFHVKGNTEDFLCLSFCSTFSESVGDKYASTVPDLFLQIAQVRI